jgi:UDP-3-O-[3-hydroxymyristoyl] glucosamine N-acyltransferase
LEKRLIPHSTKPHSMEFSIPQIAAILGGEIIPSGTLNDKINNVCKIQEGIKGAIAFLANEKYEPFLYTCEASAILVKKGMPLREPVRATLIAVEDPYSSFAILLNEYQRLKTISKKGIEQPSFVSPTAQLGENVYIGAFAYIGEGARIAKNAKIYPQCYVGDNVIIGENSILYPGVKVYASSKIGNFCTVQAGAVIGSEGFGFAPQADGTFKNVPQIGNVVLEDHVDIGANTTIDCATLGSTVIQSGVKLDNLVQIAHNVQIGKNTVIAAQTGVAGSTTLGENCMIAGQVGFIGHIQVANRTKVAAQAGIGKSITVEGKTFGSAVPAFDHVESLRTIAVYRKLPELRARVEELEKKILSLSK